MQEYNEEENQEESNDHLLGEFQSRFNLNRKQIRKMKEPTKQKFSHRVKKAWKKDK
jgi:hypothetical protein